MFCHVGKDQVLSIHDVSSVYHVPLLLKSQGIIEFLQKRLNLNTISISRGLLDYGESLQSRWKALTQGYVGGPTTKFSWLAHLRLRPWPHVGKRGSTSLLTLS